MNQHCEWYPDEHNSSFLEQWYCDLTFGEITVTLYIRNRGYASLWDGIIYIIRDGDMREFENLLKRKDYERKDVESAKRHVEAIFERMKRRGLIE